MNLILASQSPRRKALLEQFGIDFSVQVLSHTEKEEGEPNNVASTNATAKAVPVSLENPDSLVLGADTIVTLDGHILGKPKNATDAYAMLSFLSGREHNVTTWVVLSRNGQVVRSFSETTSVKFRDLDDEEIHAYIGTANLTIKLAAMAFKGMADYLLKV